MDVEDLVMKAEIYDIVGKPTALVPTSNELVFKPGADVASSKEKRVLKLNFDTANKAWSRILGPQGLHYMTKSAVAWTIGENNTEYHQYQPVPETIELDLCILTRRKTKDGTGETITVSDPLATVTHTVKKMR